MTEFSLDVLPYNDAHKAVLLQGPAARNWSDLFENGLNVTDNEILVHAMFQQQHDRDGFRTYEELATRVHISAAEFRSYFDLSGPMIRALSKAADVPKGQTERLGVAIAILAANRVSGLTEADWKRIKESSKHKTLDHEWRASDGKRFVRVEAKGTVSDAKTTLHTPTVIRMKDDIEAKKLDARSASFGTPSVEYGLITAVSSGAHAPTVFALDPPGPDEPEDPRRDRLITRLDFYARHLAFVSRFRMLTVLRNRMNAITALSALSDLDGVALVRDDGDPFALPIAFGSRPILEVDGVVGRVLFAPRRLRRNTFEGLGYALFVGFQRELFDVLAQQRYDDILGYRVARRTGERSVLVSSANRGPGIRGKLAFSVNEAGIAFGSMASDDLDEGALPR